MCVCTCVRVCVCLHVCVCVCVCVRVHVCVCVALRLSLLYWFTFFLLSEIVPAGYHKIQYEYKAMYQKNELLHSNINYLRDLLVKFRSESNSTQEGEVFPSVPACEVCVRVCARVCVYICTHTYVHTHLHVHLYMYVCMQCILPRYMYI